MTDTVNLTTGSVVNSINWETHDELQKGDKETYNKYISTPEFLAFLNEHWVTIRTESPELTEIKSVTPADTHITEVKVSYGRICLNGIKKDRINTLYIASSKCKDLSPAMVEQWINSAVSKVPLTKVGELLYDLRKFEVREITFGRNICVGNMPNFFNQ